MTGRSVVVGVGDVYGATAELDWAAREAASSQRTLRVVRAWNLVANMFPWDSVTDRTIKADLHRHAREQLNRAQTYLRETWPEVVVDPLLVEGPAADVLVRESDRAAVVVLGSRRLGAVGRALVGSVSTIVAARAQGPVVVVEGLAGLPAEHSDVVVGVDGSAATQDVLAFAFDYASRRGHALRAVFCYRPDLVARGYRHGLEERAQRWLAELTSGWQEKYPDVLIRRVVSREHPIEALAAISTGQELLVVGGHSRHARSASMLGSVSQGALHHAVCPVAVVHEAVRRQPAQR
jgi:nucleotide-binding universal stress UspA family protein